MTPQAKADPLAELLADLTAELADRLRELSKRIRSMDESEDAPWRLVRLASSLELANGIVNKLEQSV
jgi:vacuolar-type H+-ATPase catalytic subunit A/Vma1